MPDRSAFDLASLLLPEPRGRLLVVGRHPGAERHLDEGWDEVVFRDADDDVAFDGSRFAAVLLAGAGGGPRMPADTPVGAIVSSGAAIRRRPRVLVRDAFPLYGRPLLWRPPGAPGRPSPVASPRGRVDFLKMDLLWPLEPLRRFGCGSTVVADGERSLIGRLLAASGLTGADWQQTRTGTLVAIGRSRVLKVPLERVEPGFYETQDRKVARLRASLGSTSVERLFPAEQEEVRVGGWTASLGKRLPGRSAFRALGRRGRLRRVFASGAAFLEGWYERERASRPVDAALFHEFWERPLAPLATALAAEGEGELWRELRALLETRALGRPLFLVPQHGDFWLNNLLVDDDFELTGVVDWDLASSRNLPLLDLFHLVVWRTRVLIPDLSIRLLRDLLSDGSGMRATAILRHCERIGLEPRWVPDLSCRYWLGQIAQRIDEFFPGRRCLPGLRLIREYLGG